MLSAIPPAPFETLGQLEPNLSEMPTVQKARSHAEATFYTTEVLLMFPQKEKLQ